eukprot:837904_1
MLPSPVTVTLTFVYAIYYSMHLIHPLKEMEFMTTYKLEIMISIKSNLFKQKWKMHKRQARIDQLKREKQPWIQQWMTLHNQRTEKATPKNEMIHITLQPSKSQMMPPKPMQILVTFMDQTNRAMDANGRRQCGHGGKQCGDGRRQRGDDEKQGRKK